MTTHNKNLFLSFGFIILIAVSAQVSIPMEPVPLTLQTLAIFLTATLLPRYYALVTVIFYVLLGAIGLPVFANARSGLGVVFGPTGGFVFGFVLITWLLSMMTKHARSTRSSHSAGELAKKIIIPCALASVILQLTGIIWGKIYTGNSWSEMYASWLQPFYINMISKVILATAITVIVWKKFPEGR